MASRFEEFPVFSLRLNPTLVFGENYKNFRQVGYLANPVSGAECSEELFLISQNSLFLIWFLSKVLSKAHGRNYAFVSIRWELRDQRPAEALKPRMSLPTVPRTLILITSNRGYVMTDGIFVIVFKLFLLSLVILRASVTQYSSLLLLSSTTLTM